MAVFRFIMNLFRRRTGQYEVWDTSALSNHFELFKKTLQEGLVTLIIPEGVSHEISVGRRNNDNCKEIYKFIEGNIRNPMLHVEVASDAIRSWAVDEQVVYTVEKYHKKGYTIRLITCDRDQSFKAKLKELNVELLSVSRARVAAYAQIDKHIRELASKQEDAPVIVPVNTETEQKNEDIELPARIVGKQCVLAFNKNVSVYDNRGRRKIPRPEGTVVANGDTVYYKDEKCVIKKICRDTVVMCTAI
ncbi:MAG: hypothetical protein IKL68_03195 [Clostridia bacterium]|nr:hypothetical protein [Clostridia bacterium]